MQLNGVDAKNHEVYSELTRVKQYFEKIKNIGNPPPKPEKSLDTEAAIRFVRSDLVSRAIHLYHCRVLTVIRPTTRMSRRS